MCQILNVIASPEIESGLLTSLFEQRSVHWREPDEGGQSTRALASNLESRAVEIEPNYPRAAEILRKAAASYHSLADMEDQERLL